MIAEGTITPFTFIKAGTLGGGGGLVCGLGDRPIGISFKDSRRSDYVDTTAAPGTLALVNEPFSIYTEASECFLRIGSGGCVQGDVLKPDSSGFGIVDASDTISYGAVALQTGASGDIAKVEVRIRVMTGAN